jgi:peptide/nickel transport system permease protein
MEILSVKLIFLYTDILLFLLLGIGLTYFCYARKHEHLYAPWKHLAKNKIAMGSAVILITYLSIAIIDSVHFQLADPLQQDEQNDKNISIEKRYQTETLSLLDLSLTHLRTHTEKSYSAPFATHLYTKENIELADGTTIRDYPKLQYGGAHLSEEHSKTSDITIKTLIGIIKGLAISGLLLLWIAFSVSRRHQQRFVSSIYAILRNQTQSQWRTFLSAFTILLVITGISVELSHGYHIFGTDKIGESVLYQSLKSIRTGIMIGTLTTLVMLPFAIILGIAAGYFRGWIDDLIQYIYTTLNSIPGVLLIASSILMLQVYLDNNPEQYTSLLERADLRLLFLCMILGVTSWTGLCRYLRAESLKLREMDYIAAARTMGVGHGTILLRHILPNVMHIVLITVVLDFSGLVLAEAVLAYVQIGVDPTTESWGNMINSARLEMARDPIVWWSLTAAFVFMLVLVLAANLFSDAVRDALDPRGRSHD